MRLKTQFRETNDKQLLPISPDQLSYDKCIICKMCFEDMTVHLIFYKSNYDTITVCGIKMNYSGWEIEHL